MKKRMTSLVIGTLVAAAWTLVVAVWAGCDSIEPRSPQTPPPTGKSLAALKTAQDCDEVLALLKEKTLEDMEARIEQAFQVAIEMTKYGCIMYANEDGAGPPTAGGGATHYSETNVQVAGVDEADFVKNDGKFLYVLANGEFQVIQAWPAPQTHTVAKVKVEGEPKRMYVHADRAVLYSALGPIAQPTYRDGWGWYGGPMYDGGSGDCTYGYDCDFTGDGQVLKVTVLDITDRAAATLLREMVFSGSYLNSRRIGEVVHTVVVFPEVSVPGLQYWPKELEDPWQWCGTPDEFPYTEAELRAMFDALAEANRAVIEAATIAQFLPGLKDTRYLAGEPVVDEGLLGDCEGFYLSQAGDGKNFVSLVSFEMDELGAIAFSTIVGRPGAVYASHDALYVAERHYQDQMQAWYFDSSEGIAEATTVHKFSLTPDSIATQYVASGAVKGRVLNQFSMDEKDGYLRIATTNGHVPDPNVYSTLAVLAESQGELVVVGMADHIAPTEDIRSARFDGDKGFLVTFKKTDPLFTVDLSDPTNPRIAGELKIPGFSTYMHLLDDGHVLSIGFDADDHGDFAYFDGLMLQVFDVSALDQPSLMHKEVIGTRGSTSDAATNHLAFNYFPYEKLLAVPIVICEGGDDGRYGTSMTFTGLLVYRVTVEDGFQRIGGIPHAPPSYDTNACGNWWTQSNSHVKRSVFMSDHADTWVYSIALDKIQVSNLEDLEHPVASVHL